MTYVVTILVMLAAFIVVGGPLIRSARIGREESNGSSRLDDLIGRRDAAYRAIKELDFEYQLGNISESDYRSLRERCRSEAAAILRELDTAVNEIDADETARSDPTTAPAAASALPAQVDPPCPSCGGPTDAGDRYCRFCGAPLEAGA
jgi:hypothetical protein